jgi:hypothetical protein
MKSTVLFLVAYLATCIFAGGLPGGFERVWIFYAYQIDLLNPAASRTIAPNCSGKGPGGSCYFTELMEVVEGVPKGTFSNDPASEYLPDNPKNLSPDPGSTARYIFNQGWAETDLQAQNFMKGGDKRYILMIQNVAKVIGDARNNLPADTLLANKSLFEQAYESLRQAVGYRSKEWLDNLRPMIKSNLGDITFSHNDSEFGKWLDLVSAAADPENADIKDIDARISKYIGDTYPKGDPIRASHWKVIATMNTARDTSHRNCNAFPGAT